MNGSKPRTAAPVLAALIVAACNGDGTTAPDADERAPAFDLSGTWRLFDGTGSGSGFQRWWLFELAQVGSNISGTTLEGLESFSSGLGRSNTPFADPRPVQVEANGAVVVLSFNMDEDPEIERLQGELREGVMDGAGWVAQRVIRPVAPTNLAAEPISATEVRLSWTDNSDNETGFRVEIRCCGRDFASIGEAPADAESVVVFELEPNVAYEFRLSAVWSDRWEARDWNLYSEPSNVAGATPR